MRIRLSHSLPLVFALLIAFAAPLLLAQAPPSKRDPVERDLGTDRLSFGGTVSVTRPVGGDLIAAGGDVDVAAEVGGDAVVAGGKVRLGSPIKQGLYAAGGRVSINGPVQRSARIVGGSVEIGPQARIAGNVTAAGGEIRISGAVDGYLLVGGGHVVIDGPVTGNVEVTGRTIELGPNARIGGRLRYASRDEIRQDSAAQVQGGIQRLAARTDWAAPTGVRGRFGRGVGWVWSAGLVVLAAILAAALPGVFERVSTTVHTRWALSLLLGFAALVCIPVAALVAMFTLIGVPLALGTIALYPALLLVGYVSTGISAGQIALSRFQSAHAAKTGWRVAAAMLGMLAISLLGRLPWIGWVVVLGAMLIGIGALAMQVAPTKAAKAG